MDCIVVRNMDLDCPIDFYLIYSESWGPGSYFECPKNGHVCP